MTSGSRTLRAARPALRLALLLLATACASGRTATSHGTLARTPDAAPEASTGRRGLPRAVSGEFDPLGPILERRTELALTPVQAETVRNHRREFRSAGRAAVAALDSLDWSLQGKLRPWLATAWGAPPSRLGSAFGPKLTPEQFARFERHVGELRQLAKDARRTLDEVLTAEQTESLRRFEKRDAQAARKPTPTPGTLRR